MPAEFYEATAMMYMYSGLPFVPYFPMISSACVPPQCTGQVSYLPSPTRREDFFFRGCKSMERPLGLPSGPQAGGDSVAVPGPNNTNGRSVKLLAEGCPSSTMGDGALTEACGHRSSSAQDKNQLKFGIDKILGNSAFPASRRTDKISVDAFDTGDRDGTNIGICGTTKHSEARGPVTAGNGWRDDYSVHPAGYPRRTSADDHAKTDCELPRKFSPVGDYCQGCYHDKSSLLPYNGSWSYSQYSYRLDHNHLYSSKESVPVQLPHPQQPHTTPNPRLPGRRKRSWSRAVFTNLQRKGLEKRFEMQKYVNKPDRRQLAAALGLTDAQVKVWFQNRRMKWRHFQRMQKQQRQATDKSSIEAGQQLTDDSSGPDEECLTADRSALPAAREKDESLQDRDRFTTDNHGLQRNKCSWMQK